MECLCLFQNLRFGFYLSLFCYEAAFLTIQLPKVEKQSRLCIVKLNSCEKVSLVPSPPLSCSQRSLVNLFLCWCKFCDEGIQAGAGLRVNREEEGAEPSYFSCDEMSDSFLCLI